MPWIALAAAAVGAVAGSQKDSTTNYQEGATTSGIRLQNFDTLNQGRSGLEAASYEGQLKNYNDLSDLVGRGPGANEVSANTQFQNQYAQQLQQLMGNIANPNQQQNFATAQQYFAPQQTALNQQFEQQGVQSNRLAARLGRAGNDPILRNKLSQEQTRQQTMLNSQIGQFGQELPAFQANQIMGVGNALSNLRGGLATQAMNNRSQMLSMGQQLAASERQYRINTAQQYGSSYSHGETLSGGGMKGALGGAMQGFSMGMGMPSMGGGAAPAAVGTASMGRMGQSPSM